MSRTGNEVPPAARVGGWALVVAALGFLAVFGWLAVRFDYPDVLDGSAADVLPKLLALGDAGRAVWMAYAFLPLLLIPAGVGAHAALRDEAPSAVRAALLLAAVAAVSMLLGLARWPSVHWELALAWRGAAPDARIALGAVFAGLNAYLGNVVGEFLGEIALNGFFALTAHAMLRAGRRWAGYAGWAAALVGLVAAFRNVTSLVGPVAELNNLVLPAWLIAQGVLLATGRAARRVPSSEVGPTALVPDRADPVAAGATTRRRPTSRRQGAAAAGMASGADAAMSTGAR